MTQPPPHRSYSQLSTFQQCPHKYYLSKVLQLPERPAVFLAAGSALHEVIEQVNYHFYREFYIQEEAKRAED